MFKRVKDQALMRCPMASVYIFSAYKCIDNPMLILEVFGVLAVFCLFRQHKLIVNIEDKQTNKIAS